ncbi:MAG TPA: RNA-binding domain-containing protein [Acidimicrobiales bacterium]
MSELLKQWRLDREASGPSHLQQATVISYESNLRRFEESGGRLDTALSEEIERWVDSKVGRQGPTLTPESRARALNAFLNFYTWAIEKGIRHDNPTPEIPRIEVSSRAVVTTDEVKAALAATDDDERCWVVLMAFEGLKAIDIAALLVDDLQLKDEPPTRRTRTGELVLLHPRTVEELKPDTLPTSGPLFPGFDNLRISQYLSRKLRAAGLQTKPDSLTTYSDSIAKEIAYPRGVRPDQGTRGSAKQVSTFVRLSPYAEISTTDLVVKMEDHFLEHKQTYLYDVQTKVANPKLSDSVMDRICGFSNAEGGVLLIGVEDRTGRVTGLGLDLKLVQDLDALLNRVNQKLKNDLASIAPLVRIAPNLVGTASVLRIEVPAGERPLFLNERFMVRINNTTQELRGSAQLDYIYSRFGSS